MERRICVWNFNSISMLVDKLYDYLLHKPRTAKEGKVYLSKFFAIIGTITSAFFLFLAVAAYCDEAIWTSVFFLCFSLIGATLIIAFINCRIYYDDEGFIAKNFFGIKRSFSYDQVTAIKENMHEVYIYIDKRKVMVDEFSVGGIAFITLVKKRYSALNNGQNIPAYKAKKDIFNGNIKNKESLLALYILMSIFFIGIIAFLICDIFIPKSVDNTIQHTTSFLSCKVKEDEMILYSTSQKIYKIRFDTEKIDVQAIKAICNSKTVITTYSTEVTPDDEEDYYSIMAIKYNNKYLLSFEESNILYRQKCLPILLFFIFLSLLWVAYIVLSIIIGRNPKKFSEKFSKKFIGLFFKDGYIDINYKTD